MFPTTSCTNAGTPASAAPTAPLRSPVPGRESTAVPGAGRGRRRPNAGCTERLRKTLRLLTLNERRTMPPKPESKVEAAKRQGRHLRGTIAETLASAASHFEHDDVHLLKFHGT